VTVAAGLHRDVLRDPAGEIVWVRDWAPNVLVDGLRSLLAALLKGDPQGAGLGFWAVGAGTAAWDAPTGVPVDSVRRAWTGLAAEVARKPLTAGAMTFVGGTLTNVIEVTTHLTAADVPAGPLREFGLFAGGTAALGSGVLVNHRVHPRIDVAAGFSLDRTVRLTF
jgi:hypothetical protein